MSRSTFLCIDGHTCGAPVRLVAGGGPVLAGATMADRRLHFMTEFDWVRTGLMYEPRGHDMMAGAILYPSTRPDCDAAVLFIEASGCFPMCGHGVIGTVTMGLENGLVRPASPGVVRLDTPAGVVSATYRRTGDRISEVRILGVPSFVHEGGIPVDCPGLGRVDVDIAFGGNFFAIVRPTEHAEAFDDVPASQFVAWGAVLRHDLNLGHEPVHPELPEKRGVSHVSWVTTPRHARADGRSVTFYGDAAIDRSPCGTGTAARMAHEAALGRLSVGDAYVHESAIGSLFEGRVESSVTVCGKDGIVPSIGGWAMMTGLNTIFVDDEDPFSRGFRLR